MITAKLQGAWKNDDGSDGCFCLKDTSSDKIIGHMNVYDAQWLADSINIQLADREMSERER